MKKLLVLTMVSVTLFSCSQTPEEKILSQAEDMVQKEIVPNLKDPKSFEKSEIILDTIPTKEWLKELMVTNLNTMNHNLDMSNIWIGTDNEKAREFLNENLPLQKTNDSLRAVYDKTSDTSIARIEVNYSYRAKNGFGALDVHTAKLCYVPSEDKLTIWEK
jgi:hypothetical protein